MAGRYKGKRRPREDVAETIAADKKPYGGERVHAVQIGLGTFGTFIQNLAGRRGDWDKLISWLLESTSASGLPSEFKGVAVEPVSEHVLRLRRLESKLPQVTLVQAAIGDADVDSVEMHVLPKALHDALVNSVPERYRKGLRDELVYLRNMTCVGDVHPIFYSCRRRAWDRFWVDVELECQRTEVWTYGHLASKLDFVGCELLIVDAEGHDAAILRSMISHCHEQESLGRDAWPNVIVFEMAGHCDSKEGSASEAAVLAQLENSGYVMFGQDYMNIFLVKHDIFAKSERLQNWLRDLYCHYCHGSGRQHWPICMNSGEMFCYACKSLGKHGW